MRPRDLTAEWGLPMLVRIVLARVLIVALAFVDAVAWYVAIRTNVAENCSTGWVCSGFLRDASER